VKRRIALLFHEHDRRRDLSGYLIHHFAEAWRAQGHEVVRVFGAGEYVPADIALVHVDLSLVPDEYLALAGRYPIALNARVKDIRKSAFSRNVLRPDDADEYDGPVIVKSDLNNAGQPERRLARAALRSPLRRLAARCRGIGAVRFRSALDYHVYSSLRAVPRAYRDDPGVVVERFLPERAGGMYHLRVYHFLGDRSSCSRMASPHPIVTAATCRAIEPVAPHPEIEARRQALGLDYGKLDYVVRDGEAILLDVNKTTARASLPLTPERLARWRDRAAGLFAYLDGEPGRRRAALPVDG
jgi:hypothetical protein